MVYIRFFNVNETLMKFSDTPISIQLGGTPIGTRPPVAAAAQR
jgi:hypothetical protein